MTNGSRVILSEVADGKTVPIQRIVEPMALAANANINEVVICETFHPQVF
jgi:hypothetical protein